MIRGKSFIEQVTPKLVALEYRECNFRFHQPIEVDGKKVGIRMFPGDDTPRTFIDCNLVNRELPPGSTVQGGITAIIEHDVVMDTQEVMIDGELITTYDKSKFVYGHYDRDTQELIYKSTPEEIPQPRKELIDD